tara:strand:+ start:6313 stop:6567 length:255 start_codon:yes stop_codon:yes gene_type:complete
MLNQTSSGATTEKTDGNAPTRMQKATSLDWLGQTLASLCWIISVFVYANGELSSMSNGDWLQLAAASCWMASNIASLLAINPGK